MELKPLTATLAPKPGMEPGPAEVLAGEPSIDDEPVPGSPSRVYVSDIGQPLYRGEVALKHPEAPRIALCL